MLFIETPVFTRLIDSILSDEEYKDLQSVLVSNPLAGDLIPGGRGLRKIRWSLPGTGKSGGIRVIYYFYSREDHIYMLMPFKKSDQEDLTKDQLKKLTQYVKGGVL